MTIATDRRAVRGLDVLLSAISAVSWAFLAMAGVAALGLHLLGADAAGSLGPMTAALVVLATGGSVSPSGSVEAFGLQGAGAHTSIDIAPLGVSLVGALLLGWLFARSLRTAGPSVRLTELALRAGALAALFLLLLGGLCWAGSSTITFDGKRLGLGQGDGGGPVLNIPGLGDIGGGLADGLGGLARSKASVGFAVRTGPSLLGGAVWVLAVLLITVLAARRAPLPPGWGRLHRDVRPAVSALCAVLVLAVGAGWAAAAVALSHDDHPGRVAGATLLGAPNGVWLGVPLGLLVPWHGTASGSLLRFLPDPLDRLLAARAGASVTVSRLAQLEPRIWLLTVACVLLILLAGVLTAARTPRGGRSVTAFAGRCALSLGATTALALPLLVLATRLKADAGLSVLGVDAVGAGLDLQGSLPAALALGALWGLAAGFLGALLTTATSTTGRRAAPLAAASMEAGTDGYASPYGQGYGPAPGQANGPTAAGYRHSSPPSGTQQAPSAPGHRPQPPTGGYGPGPTAPGYAPEAGAAGYGQGPPQGFGPPPDYGPGEAGHGPDGAGYGPPSQQGPHGAAYGPPSQQGPRGAAYGPPPGQQPGQAGYGPPLRHQPREAGYGAPPGQGPGNVGYKPQPRHGPRYAGYGPPPQPGPGRAEHNPPPRHQPSAAPPPEYGPEPAGGPAPGYGPASRGSGDGPPGRYGSRPEPGPGGPPPGFGPPSDYWPRQAGDEPPTQPAPSGTPRFGPPPDRRPGHTGDGPPSEPGQSGDRHRPSTPRLGPPPEHRPERTGDEPPP
ncbi:streptophobe family protein [Streptomyces orinoci]|uniref:Streptophobe family protein n=1 Tax=Streptomyces orinoci TaxID=67339 RepID=A0ABV3JYF4_STRON